jgi:hypothetical protein
MSFVIITVHEHEGNFFSHSREAKLYENGTLEYLPEPVYEEDEDDLIVTMDDEEEEEEVGCMKS